MFGARVKRLLLRLKQKAEVCDFNSPVPNKGGILQALPGKEGPGVLGQWTAEIGSVQPAVQYLPSVS